MVSGIREAQTGKKRNPETRRKGDKEPTFLEKQVREGLMSSCGAKDNKATVFMEKAGAATATAAAAAEVLSRVSPIQEKKNRKSGGKEKLVASSFFSGKWNQASEVGKSIRGGRCSRSP
jgi:hypothetical protein